MSQDARMKLRLPTPEEALAIDEAAILEGNTGPKMLMAVGRSETPGKRLVHMVQFSSVEVDNEIAEGLPPMTPEADPRFRILQATFRRVGP